MPPESPGEDILLARLASESPTDRAARQAYERWITIARIWAGFERHGVLENVDRWDALVRALWPTMPEAHRVALLDRARADAALTLRRPTSFESVMTVDMAELLRSRGLRER